MATIHDYGDAGSPLDNPPLGGPDGWAAAVAAAINSIPHVQAGTFAGPAGKDGDAVVALSGFTTLPAIQLQVVADVAGVGNWDAANYRLLVLKDWSTTASFVVYAYDDSSGTPKRVPAGTPLRFNWTATAVPQ